MPKVKFLDLRNEITQLETEMKKKIDEICFNKTNFISGEEVSTFEKNFSNFINVKHCIGVANGTDALEIAVKVLNLNNDDEIITQSNTYVSTCLGVSNNNLSLKIIDVNEKTYQMDLDLLEQNITEKTKAVIIVHLTGSSCNMDRLMEIINKHNLILIEDCAQSHGALYNGKKLGTFGLMSTFSFYPGKNLGAFGDGGAICTNDDDLVSLIRMYKNNGCIVKYEHKIIGRNSRLDTLQASMLDIKLRYLDLNNSRRRDNAEYYRTFLKDIPEIDIPEIEDLCVPVYHLYIIRTDRRDELQKYLKENDIETGIHYPISIYELECYKNKLNTSQIASKAIQNSKKILSLPMYPGLTKDDIKYVCDAIKNYFTPLHI